MATTPSFAATPHIGAALLNAIGNAARDGTGTLVDVITGTANGTRVDRIDVMQAGAEGVAPTAGLVRLFLDSGSVTRLFREVTIAATAPTGTVAGVLASIVFGNGVVLPSGWKIKATCNKNGGGDLFNVIAYGGDL